MIGKNTNRQFVDKNMQIVNKHGQNIATPAVFIEMWIKTMASSFSHIKLA